MNVAILLHRRDAELFLTRYPNERVQVIAGGVDTFAYLEQRHIRYQRLTRYFDLRKTKSEWGTARKISDRFLHQPRVASLYKKDTDYRYPIHQLLKYLLTDIVRNQGIADRILTNNRAAICYISNTLTEPLVQKLHNQEFTLVNHVLIQLCKQKNIQVCFIQNHHYFHGLKLLEIISKLFIETIINAGRSVFKKYSFQKYFNRPRQTILFSASNHQLTNTRGLIDCLRQQWNIIAVGKLKKADETKYTKKDIMFVPLNSIIRYLSFTDLISTLLLTSRIFIGFLLITSKLKRQYFDKALGSSFWNLLGPSLGLYSSLLIYEVTLYSKYIERLWQTSPFKFILASNNIDPFHFSLLSFAQSHSIPYALLVHDAQGSTFCDFFFKPNDTLFVWGDFQNRIMKRDYPNLQCVITGHPDFDDVITVTGKHSSISAFLSKRKLKILILSTYNPYVQFPNQEVLFDVFLELDKIKKYRISVTLKSHPSEHHAKLVSLVRKTISYPLRWSLEDAGKLIRENDIIITQSTSAGFLAILSRKPTVYLNVHDLKDYEPYSKEGAALGVYSIYKLNQEIESLITRPDLNEKKQDLFVQDFCFKPAEGASSRIVAYIQTTINKQ